MRLQSDPNGVQNPQEELNPAAFEMVCSAEFTQGCVEPLEDEQLVAPQAEDIFFSETVCSAEFHDGCIVPKEEVEPA